jgi:membrane protein YqaA with SNARE-associated domain
VCDLKRQAIFSILGVIVVAMISGGLLWRLMVQGDNLGQLGLVGILIAALLSHLTVVARDMFFPLFLPLAAVYHPVILGTAAGTGAAIGEVTTYFLGWGIAESIEPPTESEDRIARWINKYGLWAVLLVALTPLPDTPIVILAGSRKLPFGKLAIVEIVGKSMLYSVAALMGGLVYGGLEDTVGTVIASIFMVVVSLVFSIAVTWKPSRDFIFGWMEKLVPKMKE